MSSSDSVNLIRGRALLPETLDRQQKPPWFRVRPPGSSGYLRLKTIMKDLDLRTVCEEAACPNIGDCWHHGTATFMILGEVCTRACGYCNVIHGRPGLVDPKEPLRLAQAVARMNLSYVVVTSVDRDDLPDGGASIFSATIKSIRSLVPQCKVEVLIPDFRGCSIDLETVLDTGPDILNHNVETVERLYPKARPAGRYHRALALLERVSRHTPRIPVKSGLMVGLGEKWSELITVLHDLRSVGCEILTIGQYLRPSRAHMPVDRYYNPDEFVALKECATKLGFLHVESGPLVRSSYHAHEQALALERLSHA